MKANFEDLYHNLTRTLSTSINKFSIEVLYKKKNRKDKFWYDNERNIARKTIKDVSNESLKYDKIQRHKALIKRKKIHDINTKKEKLLHVSKLYPKRFWR